MLREGERAPDFTGKLSDGGTISLRDLRGAGPVVLYFYPRDFTPGCTREAVCFRDASAELAGFGAKVVGISRDPPARHQEFAATHQLKHPLVSDESGAIARLYDVGWMSGMLPINKRVTYVIDREGTIRGVIHAEIAIDKHVENVRGILKRIARS